MSTFCGLVAHEFRMYLRRPGLWLAYFCLYIFYWLVLFASTPGGREMAFTTEALWPTACEILFYTNMFMVVLAGILAADRLQRDVRLGVRELQQSTPLRLPVYLLGKYAGVLAASLMPMLVWVLIVAGIGLWRGAPVSFVGVLLVVALGMGVPAHAFVVAFSLACPLVMPVRVYQVLFTGYWFWGNYLNPGVLPTISTTLLVPSGRYVMEGFFGGFSTGGRPRPLATPLEAGLNLIVLAACIAGVLVSLGYYLRGQARRA